MVGVQVTTVVDPGVVVSILTQAFADDPVTVWLQPDRRRHRQMFDTLVRRSHGPRAVFDVAARDGVPLGAGAWDPPGHRLTTREQLWSTFGSMAALGSRSRRGAELVQRFARARPAEPHWYLGLLGAAAPGMGAGSALLTHRLALIEGPAYLESSNEVNIPLFERFGFSVTDEIVLPFDGPRVWPMWRPMA
ncbi:GNAT family N-acetyltransferase [Gordonia sp. ABSL1-1]|uniref:GNAT family N-acetyltransferase n=1 Tax=Gordonia sp. ABSL1-1 TaxID=3053923 RepID=UPI0025730CDB|nr:GNAT family N-acetyltransferase [Gordonia sp. ABSL1-1]MDL9938174.1 GNAT family N-acetyltransferase [Gordonia sp. ABSL1-1]